MRHMHLNFVSFLVQNFSAFFSLFFGLGFLFFVSPFFLSFFHHSKKLFCCSLCIFFRCCPFSCEKKRVFHLLKEEEQSFVDRRVCVIGKAALFFLKTGEKKKEEFPREFH